MKKTTPAPRSELLALIQRGLKRGQAVLRPALGRLPFSVKQAVVGVGVALVAIVAIAGLGIYALSWQNLFTQVVTAAVPLPAGSVAGVRLSYHDYYRQVQLLEAANGRLQTKFTASALNQQAFALVTSYALVRRYAQEHKLVVTAGQVSTQVTKILAADGGAAAALRVLRQQNGLNRADFTQQVYNQLLAAKVQQALEADSTNRHAAYSQALGLLAQAQKGSNFDQLAARYSQDVTGTETGDQALLTAASLPTAVNAIVATLKDGQLAPQPVLTTDSVYLVKRVDTVNGVAEVRIIKLWIMNFNQWLSTQQAHNQPRAYLPQLH